MDSSRFAESLCFICQGEDGKTLCGQVLDVNMVSEPKAHLTKSKAVKRQKEKGELEVQPVTGGQPLLAYYMAGMGQGHTNIPHAKRARVEAGDGNETEM